MSEEATVRVRHVYEHQAEMFQAELNRILKEIVEEERGLIGDIKYAIDASTRENARGGFGALIIYEVPGDEE